MPSTRPKVLHVVLASEYSGAETLHAPFLRADPDALMACPPGSRTEEWAHRLGVRTVPIAARRIRVSGGTLEAVRGVGRALLAARDLRRLLNDHPERQVIVGTSVRPSAIASLAVLGLPGRRVVWTVTDLVPPNPIGAALVLLGRLTGARLVCLSHWIAERVAPHHSLISWPGVTLGPVPDADRDPANAIVVGHVSPTKRTDLAVEVAARVGAQEPRFGLDVVGRAQFRDEDRALEAALHARVRNDEQLARSVRFVGHDPDVPGRLARAGLLLHCRADEPFGMVLIEAMAAGLPVVAPAAGGPLEIGVHGATGLLYRPGDAAAASEAVLRLVRDPDLARRMGEAGRERVRTVFTAERQVAELEALIRALIPSARS